MAAVVYQRVVAEDLDLGTGTVERTMPAGGSATGHQINLGTFLPPDPPALTAADASTVDETYGAEEATVIANLRTRLNELEAVLQGLGILA